MRVNQFSLLKDRRFLPLFVTQFLGALHDNLYKNALVVLLVYGLMSSEGAEPKLLATLAAGLFILPFIFFSAIGGQLADKYPKQRMIHIIKIVEIGIAFLGAMSLLFSSVYLSFFTLFLLGTQSAFFGPCKYSILPQHLSDDELIGGNALLNTGSFLAILIGTIAGVVFIGMHNGKIIVSTAMVLCALIGYLASRFIPKAPPKSADLRVNYNPVTETMRLLGLVLSHPNSVKGAIWGAAWFYFLGGLFMAQFPNFTESTLRSNEYVLAFFMAIFSLGIAMGGLLNNRLLKGRIDALFVPFAAVGITIFSVDLFFAGSAITAPSLGLYRLSEFLSVMSHWRIVIDILAISICGGLFVVPLNAIIQHETNETTRARVVAGSAIMNALFITGSALISAVLIAQGWEIEALFLAAAIANGFIAAYIYTLMPTGLFKIFFRVKP